MPEISTLEKQRQGDWCRFKDRLAYMEHVSGRDYISASEYFRF